MEVANQFSNAQSFKFPRSDIDKMFLKCLLNLNYFGKIPKKDESSSFGCMIHTEFDCYAPCQSIITIQDKVVLKKESYFRQKSSDFQFRCSFL